MNIGKNREGVIVQAQLTLLHELQHRYGGQLLGKAGDAEQRIGLDRGTVYRIGPPVAVSEHKPAVLGYSQLSAWNSVLLHQRREELVKRGQGGVDIAGNGDRLCDSSVGRQSEQARTRQQPH